MPQPHADRAFVLLNDHRVLAYAGADPPPGTAAVYDPATGAWKDVTPLVGPDVTDTAVVRADGTIVSGRYRPERIDPTTFTWRPIDGGVQRNQAALVALPSGSVLAAGGAGASGATTMVDLFAELPIGSACVGPGDCTSGFCADGWCCDRACDAACETCATTVGTCGPSSGAAHTPPGCGRYALCVAGACATTCAGDAECVAPYRCRAGSCKGAPLGATCASPVECESGNCVDGVCCDTTCGDECKRCNLAGNEGTCSPFDGAARHTFGCAGYLCTHGVCATTCATAADCESGAPCVFGHCGAQPLGAKCSAPTDCIYGACVDGVCCSSTCLCGRCDVPGKIGTCAPRAGPAPAACGKTECLYAECDGTHTQCAFGFEDAGVVCASPTGDPWSCDGEGHCVPYATTDAGDEAGPDVDAGSTIDAMDAGDATPSASSSGCSCRVERDDDSMGGAMAALAGATLVLSERRRKRR
jgi:hypothetical protein